jgi:hypothetical protein
MTILGVKMAEPLKVETVPASGVPYPSRSLAMPVGCGTVSEPDPRLASSLEPGVEFCSSLSKELRMSTGLSGPSGSRRKSQSPQVSPSTSSSVGKTAPKKEQPVAEGPPKRTASGLTDSQKTAKPPSSPKPDPLQHVGQQQMASGKLPRGARGSGGTPPTLGAKPSSKPVSSQAAVSTASPTQPAVSTASPTQPAVSTASTAQPLVVEGPQSVKPSSVPAKQSPPQSALHSFQSASAEKKGDFEFALNYPDQKSTIEGFKMQMVVDHSMGKKDPVLKKAKEHIAKNPEDFTGGAIPDPLAKEYAKKCPQDCGTTSNLLRDVFVGPHKQAFAEQHNQAMIDYREKKLTPGSPVNKNGVISGVGPDDLAKVLRESTQPMFVQLQVMDQGGYGHAYALEQLPRASTSDPQKGYLHQSFVETHNLAEWAQHQGSEPKDLAQHPEQLKGLVNGKTAQDQMAAYRPIFLRGQERFGNESKVLQGRRDVNVVFTATPYDPSVASGNVEGLMKS